MTTPTEPTPVDEQTPELELEDTADDEEVLDMRAVRRLRGENKRLRHLLREEQENRAGITTQLESAVTRLAAMEHQEVERIASEHLIDPADVWRAQPDVQSYYDEQFQQIVPDKVREAAEAIIASKPHLARPQSSPPPTDRPIESLRSGAAPESKPKPVTWSSALHGGGA